MFDVSFATIWEGIALALPDATAVRTPEGALSYRQFEDRAARLAAALRQAGAGPGSKVACYLYNGAEYLETVFAALKIGAVPVNANYRYRGAELARLLTDADTEVLVYSGSLAGAVRQAARRVPSLRLLVRVGTAEPAEPARPEIAGPARPETAGEPFEPGPPAPALSYADVQAGNRPLPPAPRPGTDQLFMYTGGTTGRPKGVIWELGELLHGFAFATYGAMGLPTPTSLEKAVDAAVRVHAAGTRRISLPAVPLMHGTGLFNTFGTLLTGGEVVFPGGTRMDPDRTWRAVQDHGVTSLLIAGNALAQPLVNALEASERVGAPYRLSSLATIISSGTTFTDDLKAALHRRTTVTIYDGLAASEGGPFAFAVTSSAQDLPSRFRPVPGTLVLDVEDNPLTPGDPRVGVLAFGGSLPLGYYKDPARTAATYRTIAGRRCVIVGDLVGYEADGTVRFLGRGSGVINTGGEKVYPGEVEEVLLAHPAVADAVVVGEPDDAWGERVAAVIALHDDAVTTGPEVLEWARPQLAGYKLPRRLAIVPALPRTPTGKLEISRARELLATAATAATAATDPAD